MKKTLYTLFLALFTLPTAGLAAEISTHVLDLASGTGGEGIPVTLSVKQDNSWVEVSQATTGENGRVKAFDSGHDFAAGVYKLSFDMQAYQDAPFFPEIDVTFVTKEGTAHYHVPVVVSPYGYSTYRGN